MTGIRHSKVTRRTDKLLISAFARTLGFRRQESVVVDKRQESVVADKKVFHNRALVRRVSVQSPGWNSPSS